MRGAFHVRCGLLCWALLAVAQAARAQPATDPAPAHAQPATDPAPAHAQPAAAPAAPAGPAAPADRADPDAPRKPVLQPPRLLEFSPATYPPAAAESGIAGTVILQLLIDPEGAVSELQVQTPAGHGFDEAALAAAPGLRFAPATRDGVGVAARIRFPYVFELAEQPADDTPQPPAPAAVELRVLADVDGRPLPNARVELLPPEALDLPPIELRTDADGTARAADLPAAEYNLRVTARGFVERFEIETLREGELTTLSVRLERKPDPEAFGAVARVPPPPREVTRRSIGKAQLTRIPGTRGDALRTVEILPGVARPPFGGGALIIRGSSPQDSQVQLEGLQVPLLYHFGGLTSFFNSNMLESVEFFPGNFSVRYGRRRGGIVDVNVRDPKSDGLHGLADVNLIDASALVEGPIGEDWAFAGAYRRSYFDALFEAAAPADQFSVVAAPVYYDYQAITTYRAGPRNRLRLMAFGTSDRFELLFQEPVDGSASATDLDLSTELHRLQLSWYATLTDDLKHEMELAAGRTNLRFAVGTLVDFELVLNEIYLRSEWTQRIRDNVRFIYGVDMAAVPGRVRFEGPQFGAGGDPDNMGPPADTRARLATEEDFVDFQPGFYLESSLGLGDLQLILGGRMDYYRLIREFTFDPRVTALYKLSEGTTAKAGLGLFSQPPQPQQSNADIGNPELEPMRTIHAGGGLDQQLSEVLFVGAELFYKHFYDLIVGAPGGQPPFFVNEGEGRAYGLEVSARIEPKGRFFGYLSYTLSRSERRDEDGVYRLFNFDQPHILTLSSVYRMGRGWEVGGTFRLVSGNPETRPIGAIQDLDNGQYSPIFGPTNSFRAPAFNRLDLRIAKLWSFKSWKLTAYLDIQNVYNANNIEGTNYDFAYRNSASVVGLPFLPNLGVKGEF